jgi:hypothetical protein
MPTNAALGYQITLARFNGTSYIALAEVVDTTPPNVTRDEIDATHHGSPGGYKEYIPGLREGGEVPVTLNFIPSATDSLLAAFNSNTVDSWRITLSNGVTCTFAGFVKSHSPATPRDDKMTLDAVIKVSGQPVWA